MHRRGDLDFVPSSAAESDLNLRFRRVESPLELMSLILMDLVSLSSLLMMLGMIERSKRSNSYKSENL